MTIFRYVIHPIPVAIATYLSLFLSIDLDSLYIAPSIIHSLLLLSSIAASFAIFAYFRYRASKGKPRIVIFESFENEIDWKDYGTGQVSRSDENSWSGKYSLKKDKNPDPYGGYRLIGKKIKPPFLFCGWIYRSDIAEGRWADRLAIEDENNNGYGFSISHGNRVSAIERREGGKPTKSIKMDGSTPPLNKWYQFIMHVGLSGKLSLSIHDSTGVCLVNINGCWDKKYKEFDRIVIHGGYPYYVDDLKIISI